MNDTHQSEQKEQMVKIMAVIGFVVLVCLLAWLAVQVVRFMPTAFSSLANIFEDNQREYAENVQDEDNVVIVQEDEEDNTEDEVIDEEPEETMEEEQTEVEENDTTPATTPVYYRTVTTYKKPVSDPNGQIDLAATFVGVGTVNSSGKFVVGELSSNGQGAMQFIVKNIGTKTSGEWTFEVKLPNGSETTSKAQKPLLPSESSTLTIVFSNSDDDWSDVSAKVLTAYDTNLANNNFGAKLVSR